MTPALLNPGPSAKSNLIQYRSLSRAASLGQSASPALKCTDDDQRSRMRKRRTWQKRKKIRKRNRRRNRNSRRKRKNII